MWQNLHTQIGAYLMALYGTFVFGGIVGELIFRSRSAQELEPSV